MTIKKKPLMSEAGLSSLILASASRSRRDMLRRAGVDCSCEAVDIDEGVTKKRMMQVNRRPEEISAELAREKSLAISGNHPGKIILGADQILTCGDQIFDKPKNMTDAKKHLLFFRGKSHTLHTSYALVRDRDILVSGTVQPVLTMRNFSDGFLEAYLEKSGSRILASVGCYLLEDLGSQLFSRIEGDYFAILGLPLLPVMESLRKLNVLKK